MADNANRNSFENLTHSGLLRVNSKDDRNVSLGIDVFNGSTKFSVFTGAGQKPWNLTVKRQSIAYVVKLLRAMAANPAPCREAIMISQWDQEAKRANQVGQLAFGIDENLTFVIDIQHKDLNNARYIFPFKRDLSMDFSNTSLSEKDSLAAVIEYVIEILTVVAPIAERLSSQKRQMGGGGGRGNYGGGGNRGGYSGGGQGGGGGYQNNNRQSSTFGGGGGDSIDNELTY